MKTLNVRITTEQVVQVSVPDSFKDDTNLNDLPTAEFRKLLFDAGQAASDVEWSIDNYWFDYEEES